MKKIWFGIGAAIIIILLLLQTRFNIFLQLDNNGYAVEDKSVKTLLLSNPEELVEEDKVPLCEFKPLDYIYTRANSYYLGEDKKTQIDLSFPLLVNGGAGVKFIDDSSTLFDVYYDEYSTYASLAINNRIAYNPGGGRADADEYLFAGLKNGFFVNLDSFTYDDHGKERTVSLNSFIYFTKDYFTYCEQQGNQMVYRIARNMPQNALVTVNNEDLTYHQLLVNLGVISDKNSGINSNETPDEIEEIIPTPEVLDTADADTSDSDKDKNDKERKDKEPEAVPTSVASNSKSSKSSSATSKSGSSAKSGGSKSGKTGQTEKKHAAAAEDTDDAEDKDKKQKPVQGYVKPTVEVTGYQAGVYRLMVDVNVTDPAKRLHPLRKVQFEFYEQLPSGKETLATRSYTGSSGRVTVGESQIKPDTTYRVNVYFTYLDEYDNTVTESIRSDIMLTTGSLSSLGGITFKTGTEGDIKYMSTPVYYDSFVKIENATYEGKGTSSNITLADEAVYGIDPMNFEIKVTGADLSNAAFSMVSTIDSTSTDLFKRGGLVSFSSAMGLASDSHYNYEITAKDYFGNNIVFNNNTNKGEFYTCKSRPQGRITLKTNEIGKVVFDLNIVDPQKASIKPESEAALSGARDIYLAISTVENSDMSSTANIWKDCKDYIDNGYKRVKAADESSEDGPIHYLYKLKSSEYGFDTNGKLNVNITTADITDLDLDESYYAYLIADYDLNNNAGPVYHGVIGSLEFTAAGLTTLGNIYVTTSISNVTAHGATIVYHLNESKTNDVLQRLIHDVEFDITTTNGADDEIHSAVVFNDTKNTTWLTNFTGYSNVGGTWTYKASDVTDLMMDNAFFDKSMATESDPIPYYLNSMQDYRIVPTIKATYNGKKYDMNVVLSNSTFKTLKEPAKVTVDELMFAGGTLKFKVRIDDPDGAITGNSGHVVVMNLYDYGLHLKKSIRIPKNSPEIIDESSEKYIQEVFTGLDPSQKYFITFIAVEYNEGYSNNTFENNKVLKRVDITQSLDITGTIKLQELKNGLTEAMQAFTKVTINDNDGIMVAENPYYVRVEKKTTDQSGKSSYTEITSASFKKTDYSKTDGVISEQHVTGVDADSEYRMTLYIKYNNNELVLDTMEFTTEREIVPITNAYDFVTKIKNNGSEDIKYCVTDDIDLIQYEKDRQEHSDWPSSSSIVSIFNGEIDFQGFTLKHDKTNDNTQIFNNIGPTGEIYNLVYEVSDNTSIRIYDEGGLTSRNYGHIHDVIVNYKGGSGTANQYYGLLCRINSASGIIERFVVNNDPVEGSSTFSARYQCGLVCATNEGIVRNGYVYGSDINACTGGTGVGGDIYVGGIAGYQSNLGQMYNVYSLVDVVVSNPTRNANGNATDKRYGAIIGSGAGRIRNMYSIGQNVFNAIPTSGTYSGKTFDIERPGPAIGTNVNNSRDVYYWNEAGIDYTNSTRQTRIGLESLYDYSWQQGLLGSQFDTQPIEVGYYPHVIMNEELPEQEMVPLPGRESVQLVEIVGTEVKEYLDDGSSAIIEFRLSNTHNANITGIEIEYLTTDIFEDESKGYVTSSLDGYTTLYAKVSNPTAYYSQYKIKSLTASVGKSSRKLTYDPEPILYVDFYRLVTNPQEWYDYVVMKPNENARLGKDIDFTGVPISRIRVTKEYKGKLDGNKALKGKDYGFSLNNISISDDNQNYTPYVFYYLTGQISDVCVNNITLTRPSKYNNGRAGFIFTLGGIVTNLHMQDVTVKGREYMGAIAGYMEAGAELQDSSANNVTIEYFEPANTNTDGRVGGLVGYANQCHIRNCYVRDLDMKVMDIKNCEGAGGIVGYSYYCGLENLYSTGQMEIRGVNAGGIVGYHYAGDVSNVLTNLISRVNVTSYQDMVGGLVGMLNLHSTLTERNNMTGVAFGNVLCKNTSSECVSYTVGAMGGYRGTFYGSDFQLYNGMVNVPKDNNTYGLISYDEAKSPDTYTSKLGMTGAYDYSYAENAYIPHLYYSDTTIELPFQGEDAISLNKISTNKITVEEVYVNTTAQTIALDIIGPENYQVTSLTIDKLNLKKNDDGSLYFISNPTINSSGKARVVVEYLSIDKQTSFLDSYMLTKINYQGPESEIGYSDFSNDPVRIPLTLYKDIYNIQTWNQFINKDNNYGDYQNYRVVNNINFGSGEEYTTNAKIGRLIGIDGPRIELSGINLAKKSKEGVSQNLIFRLNSEISNLAFKNCTIAAEGRQCAGIVGTSAGEIYNVSFDNITINCTSSDAFVGIIGYQISGCLGKENKTLAGGSIQNNGIYMNKIRINSGTNGNNKYTGGLVGYSKTNTIIKNINATDFEVKGNGCVGGLVGGAAKITFEDITARDFKVTSIKGERVGGIVGSYEPGRTNSTTAGYFANVTLTGTPTLNVSNNYTADSSTVIAFDTAEDGTSKYIGGLIGYTNCYLMGRKYNDNDSSNATKVDGIVVKGLCDYTGGLFGYCTDSRNGISKDSLITTCRNTTGLYTRVGGIAGEVSYDTIFCLTDHTWINVTNHSYVGLCVGYKSSGSNTVQYNKVENSRIDATPNGQQIKHIGGSVGYTYGQMQYNTVYNTTVNAPGAENVGGVIGYLNHNMYRCLYYASPENSVSPQALPEYTVTGKLYVGGLAGYHNTGDLNACYSNANVVAVNYAGGLDGMYRNNYTVTQVSGKDNYSYSSVALKNNYFAGTVEAENFAGGLVGNLGLVSQISDDKVRQSGGRCNTANNGAASVTDMKKTGSSNEVAYTYRNMCLASYVIARNGSDAYAFAGNLDGFEGKANYWNCGSNLANLNQDKSGVDKAYYTLFWAGMKIKKNSGAAQALSEMTYEPGPMISKNVWLKTNNGSYDKRYVPLDLAKNKAASAYYYGRYEYDLSTSLNCRIVSSDDLKTYLPYSLIYTGGYNGGTPKWNVGNYHVDLTADVTLSVPYDSSYAGQNFLPHIRVNNNNTIDDTLTRYQAQMNMKLPIPTNGAVGYSTLEIESEQVGSEIMSVYESDVDKINIEFDSSFIDDYVDDNHDAHYFVLYYGGITDDCIVDKQLISERVYTYSYDFNKPFYIQYGTAFVSNCITDGNSATDWYTKEYFDMSGDGTNNGAKLKNGYNRRTLAHKVMVYGDRYYYIDPDEECVITGFGAGSTEELGENGEDPTATEISGEYYTIYNGKGLTKTGTIVNLETGSSTGSVTRMSKVDQPKNIEKFTYVEDEDYSYEVTTYWRYSLMNDGDYIVESPYPMYASRLNVAEFIPGEMPNIKDAVVLYEKNGDTYVTSLGLFEEGVVEDLNMGDDINAPEDFDPTGIVGMSNNFHTTKPYILVEYSNGGIVGYNYETCEYLFNKSINEEISLFEYLGEYLEETKSSVTRSYKGVANLLSEASSGDDLEKMVKLASNAEINNLEYSGESGYDAGSIKDISMLEGKKTTSVTKAKDPDAATDLEALSSTLSDGGTKKGSDTSLGIEANGTTVESSPNGAMTNGANGQGNGSSATSSPVESDGDVKGTLQSNGPKDAINESTIGGGTSETIGESTASGTTSGQNDNTAVGDGKLGMQGPGTNEQAGESLGDGTNLGSISDELDEVQKPALGEEKDDQEVTLEEEKKEIVEAEKEKTPGELKEPVSGNTTTSLENDTEDTAGTGNGNGYKSQVAVGKKSANIDDGLEEEKKDTEEEKEDVEVVRSTENLKIVFNMSTGTYEIIDVNKFISDPTYTTENARLGVKDFSAYGGYATETKNDTEKEQKRGIALYILAVMALLGGIGGGIYYKKKHNVKI